jgi:hypothetical protein
MDGAGLHKEESSIRREHSGDIHAPELNCLLVQFQSWFYQGNAEVQKVAFISNSLLA